MSEENQSVPDQGDKNMNKNMVFIIFTILAVAAVLFWARTSSREPGLSEARRAAQGEASNRPKSPEEYAQMMTALSKDMTSWGTLHASDKRLAINAVIELYEQQGKGVIRRPAEFYVQRMDEALAANAPMVNFPLDRALLFLAVMEYDFDNGKDPDMVAKEFLSPEMYEANRLRLQRQGVVQETPVAAQ